MSLLLGRHTGKLGVKDQHASNNPQRLKAAAGGREGGCKEEKGQ